MHQLYAATGRMVPMLLSRSAARPVPSSLRAYSARRPGFFSQVVDNIKQEMEKNKEMKENLKKFREEAQKLEQSDALKAARQKFNTVESEASKSSEVSDIMGNLFSKTELSETLTEICKIDPSFDQKQFLRDCENDIIPNVLEAIVRGELEVLRDWCFESTYNIIATPIAQAQKAGCRLDSKILDIENVDLAMGKVMEQGPVLIVTFQTQQIMCVRDGKGAVIEGDPEKVMRCHHVWVLCRDPNELDPKAAWRLMEMSANSTEQFV
uniref:Mitochondrial import inner membrane translocase subunit TIM44 n=1 Tax=Anopheles coluzzii TaxID=1518534 RepID=A0A8W7PBD8_ANOCL